MEKLGAGALGDVQDVERGREGSTGLDGGNVPTHQFRHDRDGQRHGFDRLRAASARDARGRAGGVVLAIRHDGGARLLDEQAHRTGGAEDQERHDERERKTSHLTILLLSERPIVDAAVRSTRQCVLVSREYWNDCVLPHGVVCRACSE